MEISKFSLMREAYLKDINIRNAFIMKVYKKGYRISTIAEYVHLTEKQVTNIIRKEEMKCQVDI